LFKLPKLVTDIDCGPIGYPGLVVRCWLNLTYEPWEPPADPKPWDSLYYHGLGRIVEALVVPGEFTETGKAETVELADAKRIYDLLNTPGFDQSIIVWAMSRYDQERQERYRAELKN